MTNFTDSAPRFYVIHPLDDAPEQKCSAEGMDTMPMSKSIRASLITLRCYLMLITLLALYRLLVLLGLFGHHVAK